MENVLIDFDIRSSYEKKSIPSKTYFIAIDYYFKEIFCE